MSFAIEIVIKNNLKTIMRIVEKKVNPATYQTVLNILFPMYQSTLRSFYFLKGLLKYSTLNQEAWEMVRQIHSIMPYTLVGIGGLEVTYQLCKKMINEKVPGDFIELGVARGGCAALMAGTIFGHGSTDVYSRRLWLFDSFEGLPEPTKDDFGQGLSKGTGEHLRPLPKGSCLGTLDEVKRLLLTTKGFPADRISFVKGWFQDTIPQTQKDIGEVAVLRIDGDWYESTKVCLNGLYQKVVPGGAIIIDDYQSCYGCKKAVDEFLVTNRLDVILVLDGRGGCYFNKPKDLCPNS